LENRITIEQSGGDYKPAGNYIKQEGHTMITMEWIRLIVLFIAVYAAGYITKLLTMIDKYMED